MAAQELKDTESHGLRPIFYVLGLLGTLGTWGRAAADGSLLHLYHALHGTDDYILPGTKDVLRTSFTGIYWPVDYFLDVLVIFFWEAVDGSHPASSAIGIYFLGQFFPIIVYFYMDGLREGHRASLIRPTLWLLSFQMCAIGCTGFLWALYFISSSPTVSGSLSSGALQKASGVPRHMTLLTVPAILLGYVVPAVCMALPSPSIVSNNFQQWALVAWNMFPLIVFSVLKFLGFLGTTSGQRNDQQSSSPQEHLRTVRIVSCISLALSSAVHISISAVSLSTVLFPFLFNAEYAKELHPASLLLPPISITSGSTVGDGVRSFFLWDQAFGYPIVMLVVILQLHVALVARGLTASWMKSAGLAMLISCVAGPGSACLALSWRRDEILFCSDEKGDGKHKRG